MQDPALNLRRIYAEICRGYSTGFYLDRQVFIKHLNHFDQVDIDLYYEEVYEEAKSRGLKSRADRLKWLNDRGLWSKKDDMEIEMQQSFISNMMKTRSKGFLKSQIQVLDKQIKEGQEKLYKDLYRKEELIGYTCEKSADTKIQFYYIYLACFKDNKLSEKMFTLDEINSLDDEDSENLLDFYINIINRFNQDSLKKISVSAYFTNYFYICGDNIASFFNKPIAELSIYQVNLLSYAIYFKSIIMNNQIPDNVKDNPDELESYVSRSKNFQETVQKSGDGNRVGIVGATAEDFKELRVKDDTDNMRAIAGKEYRDSRQAAQDLGYKSI